MRDEAVRLRSKNNDLRDERSRIKQQQEDDDAAGQTILADRDSTIENLQSLLERRNQELDILEQSVATTQKERTRLQLNSNEMTISMVSLRQELEEARTVSIAARASKEAGRQHLARLMDEQLAQNQTIEALRRQVGTRDAQALLRTTQEQQQQYSRMPPPSTHPARTGGAIGSTPFVPPFKLHQRGYAQESFMDRDITMWAHHRIQGT